MLIGIFKMFISAHQCLFCPQKFDSALAKDDHILEHFTQQTCTDCNQNLIRIGSNFYVLHTGATCIRECDYDNENYYDDVSSKLATVLVDEPYSEDEPNEQQADEMTAEVDEGGWMKSEPNFNAEEESEYINAVKSNMSEDTQPDQQEMNVSMGELINDENLPQATLYESKPNVLNINLSATVGGKSKKREDNKRECEFCGELFHKYALYRHRRDVHNPTICVCQVCFTQFKSEEYLQRHMRYKHGVTPQVFKCDQCQATFRKEDQLRTHQCSGPPNGTPSSTPNTPNSKMACECGKEFSRKQTLLKHKILVHSKNTDTIFCKACARVFSDVDERDVHQLECTTKKYQQLSSNPCACEICGKVLSRRGALQRHKALKH